MNASFNKISEKKKKFLHSHMFLGKVFWSSKKKSVPKEHFSLKKPISLNHQFLFYYSSMYFALK